MMSSSGRGSLRRCPRTARFGPADLTKMSFAHEVLAYPGRLGLIPIKIIDLGGHSSDCMSVR